MSINRNEEPQIRPMEMNRIQSRGVNASRLVPADVLKIRDATPSPSLERTDYARETNRTYLPDVPVSGGSDRTRHLRQRARTQPPEGLVRVAVSCIGDGIEELGTRQLVIVVVGPAKKLEKRLRKIAPVEIVDPKAKPPAG